MAPDRVADFLLFDGFFPAVGNNLCSAGFANFLSMLQSRYRLRGGQESHGAIGRNSKPSGFTQH